MHSPRQSSSRCALRLIGAIVMLWTVRAVADEPERVLVEVDGREFSAFVREGGAVAIATPRPVRLIRDPQQTPPQCDALNQKLASYRVWIEDCKRAGANPPAACQSIRNIVRQARTDPGLFNAPNLRQGWRIEPLADLTLPSEEAVAAQVTSATGLPSGSVSLAREAAARGSLRSIGLYVAPNGSSWASTLRGFADVSPEAITQRADVGRLVSEDHVLACGILQGEVHPFWEQDAQITTAGAASAPSLTAAQLYQVYQALVTAGPVRETEPARRLVQLGVRIGTALSALGLASSDVESRARLVVELLFEGDELLLRGGLTREAIAAGLARQRPVAFTASLSWRTREAR